MKLSRYIHLLIVIIALASCKRDEPTSWNTHVLAPIAKGRLTLDNIIPDSLLQADDNGLWHLRVTKNLTDFNLDSIVAIPDTIIRKSFTIPISGGPFNLPHGTSVINQHENNKLNINDAELRHVKIKAGRLEYTLKSYINGYLTCTYNIPGVKLNGIGTVIQAQTEPRQGNQPYIYTGQIDLAGYEMSLTGQSGFMTNRVYTHLAIITTPNAPTQAQVYGQDSVVVELKFLEPVVEYAKGYFGQHVYDLQQTVDLTNDFQMPTGTLNIDQASLNLNIVNAVGADAQIKFTTLAGLNLNSGNSVNLQHGPLYQTINITRAHDNNGSVQTTESNFALSNANSNLDVFIENLPSKIQMDAQIKINPMGDLTNGNDFIYTANSLKALLDINVPLNVGMHNLAISDTLDIATSIDMQADGKLVLQVINTFPFSATCSVQLLDGSNQVLHTLINSAHISHGMLNGNSYISTLASSLIHIPVTADQLRDVHPGNRIAIRVLFDTPEDQEHYGLYKDYYMDFKLIGDGKMEVSYE
jgi:hypothetical protein